MAGEPDNARACYRSAQLMDSSSDDQEFTSDYALLDYLDGLVTARLGGDGSDALKRAQKVARLNVAPEFQPRHNVLLFAESGKGPTKYATGDYHEELRFHSGSSQTSSIKITSGTNAVVLRPWDDLSFQATTRGGRVMDHVLANKAVFKSATDVGGTAAIIGGAIMANQRNQNSAVDEIGAGLIVAGVLSKIISASTTPAADTRTWDNLPQLLYFGSMFLPSGEHSLQAEFLDSQGRSIAGLTRNFSVQLTNQAPAIVFLTDRTQRKTAP
jgi:hypothetical protein